MRSVVGGLFVLSGAVLVAAGVVAQSANPSGDGKAGYALGGVMWIVGVAFLIASVGSRRPADRG